MVYLGQVGILGGEGDDLSTPACERLRASKCVFVCVCVCVYVLFVYVRNCMLASVCYCALKRGQCPP
jgi:hypothetical protein